MNLRLLRCFSCWVILAAIGFSSPLQADTQTKFFAALSTDQLDNPVGGVVATGTAEFLLTESDDPRRSPTLSYEILLDGLEVRANSQDVNDVWGVHLHFAPLGSAGPHVLNIYGLPRQDDADMTSDSRTNRLQGVWDDDDENLLPMNPLLPIGPGNIHMSSSRALTDMLDALKSEQIFLAIHSWGQAGEPAIGGRLRVVPEPSSLGILSCAALLFCQRRR